MFLFLSKLLPPFLFPPGFQIVLLVIALVLFRKRPRTAYGISIFAIGTLYLLSTNAVSATMMGSVESAYPAVAPEQAPHADAIVVLGDFLNPPTDKRPTLALIGESDRLRTGGLLFQAGKAPLILLTGGVVSVLGQSTAQPAMLAKNLLTLWGVPASDIKVESASQNTYENAAFSKPILDRLGVHRILLVTSAFHMPRSASIFRRAGFEVNPVPCDYRTGWTTPVFPLSWIPESRDLFNNQLALHEWLGIAVYKVRGWA